LEKDNPILYNENAIKEERFLSLLKEKPFWIENEYQHKKKRILNMVICVVGIK
jgi:hypothetical protein